MTTLLDILIEISLFTLILDILPIIFDGIDCNLAKASEFDCNNSNHNDGSIIASDICQSKGAGVELDFFQL